MCASGTMLLSMWIDGALRWLDAFTFDASSGLKSLRRSPLFAIVVITTLALGLGANAAMFTLADALLLRPLSVPDPNRLVEVRQIEPRGQPLGLLAPMVDLIRDERVFAAICGFATPSIIVEIHDRIAPVSAHLFTGDCFDTLGVRAALGRLLSRDDDRPGAPHVAMLAYDAWQHDFGGRPDAIGESINVDGTMYRIVGVAARGFRGLRVGYPAALFVPFGNFEGGLGSYFPDREQLSMVVVARLPDGMSGDAVIARLGDRWRDWLAATAPTRFSPPQRERYVLRRPHVVSASTGYDYVLRDRFRTPLVVLVAIAGLVLLVGCVNVANLFVARSMERRRATAIRSALGAPTWRLVHPPAVECGMLLAAGAAFGLVAAYWLDLLLVRLFQATSPDFAIDVSPDVRVTAFTAALSLVAFVLLAFAPAWRAGRRASFEDLSSRVIGDRARWRLAAAAAQVAVTIILVTVGAMLVQSLRAVRAAPLGFSFDRATAVQLSPLPGGYDQRGGGTAYYSALLERVAALPDVSDAALAYDPPIGDLPFSTVDVGRPGSTADLTCELAFVTGNFFATLQIPLVAGRPFEPADASRTAIISESTAYALFEAASPIDRVVRVGAAPAMQAVRVIGIARDAVLFSPQKRNTKVIYLSFWQSGPKRQEYATLLVLPRGGGRPNVDALQQAVRSAGREYVSRVRTLVERYDAQLIQERLLASISTGFSILGLLLASIGLYGVLAFTVARRTSEIGVRMALGASRGRILRLVLTSAAWVVAIGVAIGGPIAWSAARVGASIGVALTTPPIPVAAATTIVAVVAFIASWVPAWRASRIDPTRAIHSE